MKEKLKHLFNSLKKTTFRPKGVQWIMVFALSILGFLALHKMGIIGDIPQSLAQINNATAPVTTNANSVAGDAVGAVGRGLGTAVSALATLFFKLIAGILFFVLKWMGPLMDNTFILEGEIGVKIRTVWVIIRNFVNIFFALALVVVALMSVVGYGDESGNYAMKKFIPKMALALIAVNFTFLACRLVLDVNNVLTTAIFSIPKSVTTMGEIGPTGLSGQLIFKRMDCFNTQNLQNETERVTKLQKEYNGAIASIAGVCFAKEPEKTAGGTRPTFEQLKTIGLSTDPANKNKQSIISMDQSLFTKHDFIWVMATQFQGIHDLNKISALFDPNFSGLTVNALFSALFAVIYATAYISMFIILIARMAVLWITIMLSPLIAVTIVFPELKIQEFDIQEQFLKHAFVPAKMAVPMALGFIMLSQMTLSVHTGDAIFQNAEIDITGGEFARGVSFTSLIYGAASVAVLWMGVFAATKGVVGEGLVTGFSDKIKSMGRTVAKWPSYIPIVPVHGGLSVQNIGVVLQEAKTRLHETQLEKSRAKANLILDKFLPRAEITNAIKTVEAAAMRGSLDTAGLLKITSDKERFRETVVKLLNMDTAQFAQSKKRELAALAGIPYKVAGGEEKLLSHLEARSNDTEIFKNFQENLSTGGAREKAVSADYGEVHENLGFMGKLTLKDITKNQLPLTFQNFVSDDGKILITGNMTAKDLIEGLKVLPVIQRRAVLATGVLEKLAKKSKVAQHIMSTDNPVHINLIQAIDTTNADNKGNIAIRTAYEAMVEKTSDDELKTMGHIGEKMAAIDKKTGKYTPPSK